MLERVRLGGLSGTYTVKRSELARDRKTRSLNVTVLLLDDSTYTFHIGKRAKGSEVLENVFQHLDLSERDYFGLQYIQQESEVVRWVDPNKIFRKQWESVREENTTQPTLQFRVKFYVTDPSRLQEEYTRYQFYLQIKRDIFHGRLICPINTQCFLASYTVQAELGDYNPTDHRNGYLSDLQLIRDQNDEVERRISDFHKVHRGQLPADAEFNYLEHARRIETYGVDFHNATDSADRSIQLGVCSIGLLVYQNGKRQNEFSWSKMIKVSYKRKDFYIQLSREMNESSTTMLGFNLGSHRNAKALWKSCVEHHSFFRLERPHRSPRFLPLSLGSKFYYSGRTELQAMQESKERAQIAKTFVRSPSKRMLTASPVNGSSTDSNGKSQKVLRPYDNKVTSKQTTAIPRKAWETQADHNSVFIDHLIGYDISQPIYNNGADNATMLTDEDVVNVRLIADDQGRFGFNVKGGDDLRSSIFVSRVLPHTPAARSTPRICVGNQVLMINGRDVNGLKHAQVVNLIQSSRNYHNGELVLTIKQNNALANSMFEEEPLYQYVPEDDFDNLQTLDGDALYTQSLMLLSDGLASGALLNQYEKMYRKNPDLAITEARKTDNITKNRYRDISPYDCTRVVLLKSDTGDYINANYVNMEIPGGKINRYIATQGPLPNTTVDFWRMVQQESSHLVIMLTTVMERGRVKCHQYWPTVGEELSLTSGFSIKCLKEEPEETGSFVFRELLLCDKNVGETRTIQHMQYLAWPDHGVPSDPNLFLQFTEKVRSARNTTLLQEIDATLKQVKLIDADSDESGNGIIGERKYVPPTPEDETVNENGGIDGAENTTSESNTKKSTTSVHQYISSANPPIIVHCSAGIGRTGVLILMDTALALMESKEPVYPLDIVRTMRDQRACMVQNVSQYRFVCESIYVAYSQNAKRLSCSN